MSVIPALLRSDPLTGAASTGASLRYSVACAVAREAGAFARRRFDRPARHVRHQPEGPAGLPVGRRCGGRGSPRRRLLGSFPGDSFFGEEGGGLLTDDAWVVDPIDGTANFVRGISQFCISIAYVHKGRTQVGIIYDPMHDELFAAEKGLGATLNGEPLQVSGLKDLASSTIEAGWSTRLPLRRYVDVVAAPSRRRRRRAAGGSGRPCSRLRVGRPHRRLLRASHERVGCAGRPLAHRGSRRLDQRLHGGRGPSTR